MSRVSRRLANDKVDSEVKPGTLQLRKPRDISAKRQSDEDCATSYRLEWGPLPPNDICRIVQHVSTHVVHGAMGYGKKKSISIQYRDIGEL